MHAGPDKEYSAGLTTALASFCAMGLLPIYWKTLTSVDPFEILCHRIVWSLVFIAIILTATRRWSETFAPMGSLRNMAILAASSMAIGVNWLIYIWSVNTNHVVETSLGYYINPLVNIIFGFVFFRERLNPIQCVAIGLAALGVANSVVSYGGVPWISLSLAVTFALYGLFRKISVVESLPGLFLETMVLLVPALLYLGRGEFDGSAAFLNGPLSIDLLLMGAGAATAIPLIGFAFGARRLPLSVLGLLQYLAPSIAFLLGVFLYKEPFGVSHMITFSLIWAGLAVYTADSLRTFRRQRRIAKMK